MTAIGQLGRLDRVDLRSIWTTEDRDFTPWLAREDNLTLLGTALGIELELEAEERNVGPFRADILCKDTLDGSWVLIENQLERTDHIHLGQLMTYAAGLQTVTIIWVAARFTEEHRAALDWLNEITNERFRFFGLEVELWRIGDSPPAPKFNIISKPNEWSRSVGQAARTIETEALTETQALRLEFWTAFNAYISERGLPLPKRKPGPHVGHLMSIGRSHFGLQAHCSARGEWIAVSLNCYDDDAKAHFRLLKRGQAEIEREVGAPLEWFELPTKIESRIYIYKKDADPKNRTDWPRQFEWLADMLVRFDRAFRGRVKELDASEFQNEREQALSESDSLDLPGDV